MSSFRSALVALALAACAWAAPAAAQDSDASMLPVDSAPTSSDNLYVEQGSSCTTGGSPTSSPPCNPLHLSLGALQTFVLTGLTLPAADVTGLGTAATANTGTSGATLGLLNGALTFSGADKFTSALAVNLSTASPFDPEQFNVQNVDGSATYGSYWASQATSGIVFGTTGGTFASAAGTPTGQQIGDLYFCGYGVAIVCGAVIEPKTTALWSGSDNEMSIIFKATAPNSTANEVEMTLQAGVGLGSLSGQGVGTINANGYYAGGTAGATKTCTTYPTVKDGIVTSC